STRDWSSDVCSSDLTAGIIAFLGTCLMGHPLLVREVAAAFFIQLALAASLGGSALLNDVRSVRLQPDVTYGRSRPPKGGHYVRRSEERRGGTGCRSG